MLSFRVFFATLGFMQPWVPFIVGVEKNHHQGDMETTGGQLFFVRLQRGRGLFGKDEG